MNKHAEKMMWAQFDIEDYGKKIYKKIYEDSKKQIDNIINTSLTLEEIIKRLEEEEYEVVISKDINKITKASEQKLLIKSVISMETYRLIDLYKIIYNNKPRNAHLKSLAESETFDDFEMNLRKNGFKYVFNTKGKNEVLFYQYDDLLQNEIFKNPKSCFDEYKLENK